MLNRNQFENRFEKSRRRMDLFGRMFMVLWVLMFVGILGFWGLGAYLQYQCYSSRDPNSFACWYVSDRVEVGIRQR
jgi:hypothetical protein